MAAGISSSERADGEENPHPSPHVAAIPKDTTMLTPSTACGGSRVPHTAVSPHMDSVDIAQAAHNAWIASAAPELPVDPDIGVVDAHHHLWFANSNRAFVADYMLRELAGRFATLKNRLTACWI